MKTCPTCKKLFEDTEETCPSDGATLVEKPVYQDAMIGTVLKESFRIEAAIASGGMGAVYRATQLQLDRDVAVKVLLPNLRASEELIKRFFREAKLLGQLNHPNVVTIIDFGDTDNGLMFIVMEYLKGDELYNYVPEDRGLGLQEIVGIMQQICAGLSAAHQYPIIHRDIKPSNIFLSHLAGGSTSVVKVLDFGLCKGIEELDDDLTTKAGEIMGTPGYIAPEQIRGISAPDTRTDIYALGGVLFFMIAGHRPYVDTKSYASYEAQLEGPPPDIDPSRFKEPGVKVLVPIALKAMSIDPDDRYQTVEEMIADIELVTGISAGTLPQAGKRTDNNDWDLRTAVGSTQPITTKTPKPAAGGIKEKIGGAMGDAVELVVDKALGKYRRTQKILVGVIAVLALITLAFVFGGKDKEPITDVASNMAANVTNILGMGNTEPIVLGMSAAFSGPARELGRGMRLGIDTYLSVVNEEGGIKGRPFKLITLDDGYEPEKALANMEEFIGVRKVFAIIGNVGTPTAKLAVPFAVANKALFFGAFTGAGLLRKDPPDRYVFNYRASYAQETAAMVKYFLQIKKIKPEEIAVFAQDDSYGDAGFEGVAKVLREQGFDQDKILRVGYKRNTLEVKEAVATIVKQPNRARAIVMVGTYKPCAEFIQQIKNKKLNPIFANVSFVGSRALAEELIERGEGYASGVIVTQVVPHFEAQATGVIKYREALKKYFPAEQPGFVSLEGYVVAKIFVDAMKRAGPQATVEELIDVLEATKDLDLGIGTILNFSPSIHQASKKIWGTVLDASGNYQELVLE